LTDDPLEGRPPSRHEQISGRSWDASYQEGVPPWDIGRPQTAFERVASAGGFAGTVLDAGCGTGEHALLAARHGLAVLGIDVAATAIAQARAKAEERGLRVEFEVRDACKLGPVGRRFDTVLDCGLFHTFDAPERPAYITSLESVTGPGATLYLLCFSDEAPDFAPHPISRQELDAAFDHDRWAIAALEPDLIQTTFAETGFPAWFATVTRL
jgi:SAM-dependent methyltransferase